MITPLAEAALLLLAAGVGFFIHQPLIFASLGPTAYEMIETPQQPSARPYNVIMGNLVAVLAGFLALFITGAWHAAKVSTSGIPPARIWAAILAATLTVFVCLLVRASQPAALSTTLLISLGMMQQPHEGLVIMGAVLLIAIVGEPVRQARLRSRNRKQAAS